MASAEEMADIQERLQTYRRTLAHYLRQQAQLGSAFAPPGVMNGIAEARREIRRLKAILRSWGAAVEDMPDDGDVESPSSPATPSTSKVIDMRRRSLQRRIEALFEEHEAVSRQIDTVLDRGSQVRLQRQMRDLEEQIFQLESDLEKLPSS